MMKTTDFTWTHLLYRLFDADDVLLYVGRTNDFKQRCKQHSTTQPWWGDVARSAVETYSTFQQLCDAERAAIIGEKPLHNKIYNGRVYQPGDLGGLPTWLNVSARIAAGAEAHHDRHCRASRRADYPNEPDPRDDFPCVSCLLDVLAVAEAMDEATGEFRSDVADVHMALVHDENQRVIPLIRAGKRNPMAPLLSGLGRCPCDECASAWAEFDTGLWLMPDPGLAGRAR